MKKRRSVERRNKVLAEEVGFEPTVPCGTTVFKTAAFDHSAIPPHYQVTVAVSAVLQNRRNSSRSTPATLPYCTTLRACHDPSSLQTDSAQEQALPTPQEQPTLRCFRG